MTTATIGWTNFALRRHIPGTGNSYFGHLPEHVALLASANWSARQPGKGESNCNRKVVVPVPEWQFYCPPTVPLTKGLKVQGEATCRQEGEDPRLEIFVDITQIDFEPIPAKKVEIVCYSADALLEEDGKRDTDCAWEIVSVNCSGTEEPEQMDPLTMARNYLRKPGGTFSNYTALEFAEAIYNKSTKRRIKVKGAMLDGRCWVLPYFGGQLPSHDWLKWFMKQAGI
jgi:hypothetical protein